MPTYWDSFIKKYQKEILRVNTGQLLMAFWYYCNSYPEKENMKKCEDIMCK